MEHQRIDGKARVWILSRDCNGRLQEQLDPQFLTALGGAHTAEDIADVIAIAAGEMELAENRAW